MCILLKCSHNKIGITWEIHGQYNICVVCLAPQILLLYKGLSNLSLDTYYVFRLSFSSLLSLFPLLSLPSPRDGAEKVRAAAATLAATPFFICLIDYHRLFTTGGCNLHIYHPFSPSVSKTGGLIFI